MRRTLRRIGVALAWIAVGMAALLASIAYHLTLPHARKVARSLIEQSVSDRIRGRIEIGQIEELGLGHFVAHDVRLRDEAGRLAARVDRLEAWPDPRAFFEHGVIRVAAVHVDHGEVELHVQGDSVSLVEALQGVDRTPGPPGAPISPIPIEIDGIRLADVDVRGDVPHVSGLRVEDVRLYGQIRVHDSVLIRVREASARMLGPYPGETVLDRIVLDFDTDWKRGLDAYARAHRGEDRARARLALTRPGWPEDPDALFHLELSAQVDPLHLETLAAMQIPGTERLAGAVRGHARMEGTVEDLAFRGWLVHDAGPVTVRGRIPRRDRICVEIETYDFDIQRLVPSAPPVVVGGTLRLYAAREPDDPHRAEIAVRARPLDIAGIAIPAFDAEGAIERGGVVIDRITAPHRGGVIEGRGRVGFDGSLDLHARIQLDDLAGDPHIRRFAGGTHGAVAGTIDAVSGPGGSDLALTGNLRLDSVRWGAVRARRLDVRGRARGSLHSPIVRLDVEGEGVSIGGTDLGSIGLEIEGGPRAYQLRWASQGPQIRQLQVRGTATRRGGTLAFEAPDVLLNLGTGMLRGAVRGVEVRGDELRIASLELQGGGQRILAEGHVDTGGGRTQGRVDIEGIDLSLIGELAGLELGVLQGRAEAHLAIDGDSNLRLRGRIDDLSFDRMRDADIQYDFAYLDGVLTTRVHGDFGPRGDLDVEGPIEVPFEALFDPERFWDEARFGLHVYANHLNLAFVLPLLGENVQTLGITGRIGGDVSLEGTLHDPRIDPAVIILDRFALPGWTELRAKIRLALVAEELRISQFWVADAHGEIGNGQASFHVSLDDPPADLASFLRGIADRPWSLGLSLTPRRLSALPRPWGKRAPRGVVGQGSLSAAGGEGQPARADLAGSLSWVEPALDAPCARALRPEVRIEGSLRDGTTRIEVAGLTDDRQVALLRAEAPTPLDTWIREGRLNPPHPDVVLQLGALPLERVPWTCSRFAGTVVAQAQIAGALGPSPSAQARIEIVGLRVLSPTDPGLGGTHPHRILLQAGIRDTEEGARVEGCAILARDGVPTTPLGECATTPLPRDGEAIVRGSVPLAWSIDTPIPRIALAREFDLAMLMSEAQLEPLLALIPQIGEADVIADGRVEARGPWATMALQGSVVLSEGRLRIASVGQHLTEVGGTLRFSGDRVAIAEDAPLSARDGDGTVAVWGELLMEGLVPTDANLRIAPYQFPVRREGAALATITGEAEIGASIDADGMEGAVLVDRLTVRLPEQAAGALQQLDPNPAVLIVGQDDPNIELARLSRYPVHLRVEARQPFWVRRNDFAVQVTAELDVRYVDPDLYVGGYVSMARGYFEVFGKRFEVQRGSLTFTGGPELNPIVDVVAVHQLPGAGGDTVTVSVGGRMLDDFHVEFSSTETSDQGEIIALLVSGRRTLSTGVSQADQQRATEQAASFLAGLSAGILTLGLRQQFGDIVPLIAIETGRNLGDTRIRAGFDANALIPNFLREVVLGAYVEGFVTTSGGTQSGGGGGVGGGVTLEFRLPYDLVLSGTYVPPANGGIDLLWEP